MWMGAPPRHPERPIARLPVGLWRILLTKTTIANRLPRLQEGSPDMSRSLAVFAIYGAPMALKNLGKIRLFQQYWSETGHRA
jgi:hypothetical protein